MATVDLFELHVSDRIKLKPVAFEWEDLSDPSVYMAFFPTDIETALAMGPSLSFSPSSGTP